MKKMTTNEERREVAAMLRNYANLRESFEESPICAFIDALGFGGYLDWQGVSNRLADLIEPEPERTCTFSVYKTGDEHFPTCSACGYEAAREECEDYVGVVYYEKRHCPNCGARVVQE